MSGLPNNESESVAAKSWKYPLKPEPLFQERVWGEPDLSFLYPACTPAQRVGEVWLTGDQNRIRNGPRAGSSLGELAGALGSELLGSAPSFPLLVKFLFTREKLSVQVHPPDSYARRTEASLGKTEMWHVLRAEPGAKLAIGFRDDLPPAVLTNRAALREAVESGAIEQMLNWVAVQAGETFFVPAGAVHAIGAGLVLCEIQENSDITYRLYDYKRPGTDGRPRPLHVEKAFDVLEWDTCGGRTFPLDWGSTPGTRVLLAACPYFATEKWELDAPLEYRGPGHLEIWIGLEGRVEFEAAGERVLCQGGEAVILPPDVPELILRPAVASVFLRTFPPDLERDVMAPLRARGISEQRLRGVCFPQPFVRAESTP